MILVDTALKAREAAGNPIRVGLIGSGFMAQGLTNQITNSTPGMQMTAIYGRNIERAEHVYRYSGLEPVVARTQGEFEDAIANGKPVITEDPFLVCRSPQIDVICEVTGAVEFGAQVVMEAFELAGLYIKPVKPVLSANPDESLIVFSHNRQQIAT